MTAQPLTVTNVHVSIAGTPLLHGISFTVQPGERLGLIGGSGSGKTLTALTIAGLLPEHATVTGSIRLGDRELVGLTEPELARVRGDLIGMVFQEPKSALNPLRRLGRQMTESLALHYSLTKSERHDAARRLATRVGLTEPDRMIRSYPHEVSGGQRQRAAIAAAISASPGLLLADEPTTALDVTVQQGILTLFRELTETDGSSLLFITHDLAVLSEVCDRVLVFDSGRIVEHGTLNELLTAPQHPVTRALIAAAQAEGVPREAAPPAHRAQPESEPEAEAEAHR